MSATPLDLLPAKRKAFVEAYVKLLNATEAADAAGYSFPEKEGSRLLTDVGVMRAVSWLFDKHISERYQSRIMSKEEMLERLSAMSRTDLGDFLGEGEETLADGATRKVLYTTIDLAKAKKNGKLFLIKGVKSLPLNGLEVTFHDPQQAMRLIARIKGFEAASKVEHSGPNGGPIELATYDLTKLSDVELSTLTGLLSKAKKTKEPASETTEE